MDNFSATARLLPGAGTASAIGGGAFDFFAIPGFDVIQKLFLRFGLDPSLLDCRLFCVTSRKNPMSHAVRRYSSYGPFGDGSPQNDDNDEDGGGEDGGGGGEEDTLGPKLKYTPAPGYLHFWYRKHLFVINRKLDLSYYTGDIPDETMVITTIGRSPNLLRELLAEARTEYLMSQSRKTMVYGLSPTPFAQKNWDQGRHRPSRDISTVIMPQEDKSLLLHDVKEYLNPVTARWYAQRGLPYRRGYLFYGPPGTGKTSLSLALAGELKVPLYILSLSAGSLTDETLTMLFVGLPRKCIVLLEDIDCAGVQRNSVRHVEDSDSDSSSDEDDHTDDESRGSKSKSSKEGHSKEKKKSKKGDMKHSPPSSPHHRQPRMSVSFSGLLNAIDGVASHEGRILIMTTNHRERLDPALIRPGRVDMQIEFGYSGRDTLAEIFRELYSSIDGIVEEQEVFGGENEYLYDEKEHLLSNSFEKRSKKEEYKATIAELAEKFAEMIPADRYTPAEIQGYLMSYKRAPKLALKKLPRWLEKKNLEFEEKQGRRNARKEKKRVNRKPIPKNKSDDSDKQKTDNKGTTRGGLENLVSPGANGSVIVGDGEVELDTQVVMRSVQEFLIKNFKVGATDRVVHVEGFKSGVKVVENGIGSEEHTDEEVLVEHKEGRKDHRYAASETGSSESYTSS